MALRRNLYIKVGGQWMYLYRAVDERGKAVESHLSRMRDIAAAKAFFRKALKRHGQPRTITLDGFEPTIRHSGWACGMSCRPSSKLAQFVAGPQPTTCDQPQRVAIRITEPLVNFVIVVVSVEIHLCPLGLDNLHVSGG
jgi:hypothetical protein